MKITLITLGSIFALSSLANAQDWASLTTTGGSLPGGTTFSISTSADFRNGGTGSQTWTSPQGISSGGSVDTLLMTFEDNEFLTLNFSQAVIDPILNIGNVQSDIMINGGTFSAIWSQDNTGALATGSGSIVQAGNLLNYSSPNAGEVGSAQDVGIQFSGSYSSLSFSMTDILPNSSLDFDNISVSVAGTTVPEPSGALLAALAGGLAILRRRR